MTHSIFLFGLFYRTFWAFSLNQFGQLKETLLVTLILTAFAGMMYLLKQWGGGDLKLMAAYGTTIAVPPKEVLGFFSPSLGLFPFWATFLVNLFLVGAIWGLSFTFLKMVQKNLFKDACQRILDGKILFLSAAFLGLIFAFYRFYFLSAIAFASILIGMLTEAARVVEKKAFLRDVSPEEVLVEDWLVEDVLLDGEILASARSPGVSMEEKEKIMENADRLSKIKIRDGVAFGPVFPIALLFTFLKGDLIFLIMSAFIYL